MTHRQDLEQHRHSLAEIRDIMYSMKTLAYMETRKLDRYMTAQQAVVNNIEEVADDFFRFHTDLLQPSEMRTGVWVVVGSERGFCGDFNQSLARELEARHAEAPESIAAVVALGRKLHPLLESFPVPVRCIAGPGVVEEAQTILGQLVNELNALQQEHGLLTISGLYHDSSDTVTERRLLPPFQDQNRDRDPGQQLPPLLHLKPRDFLIELTDHYLFAALNQMLYASLQAENHNRVSHLEGAVRHLDDESAELSRRCNILRQEEIIEEIEVILLSTDNQLK